MDECKAARIDIQPQRYEDFEPYCKWHTPDNIFEIHLQGFRKEHLSVRTNQLGMLTIHGERPLDQTQSTWSRFHKEIKLPKNCDANRVAAKFVGGLLTITMPPQAQSSSEKPPTINHENLPKSSNIGNQTKNDKAIDKVQLTKHNNPDENDALLDEEVKPAGSCEFRPTSSASDARFKRGKYHIAVKLVLVVAVVVAFGFGAYVKYQHDHSICIYCHNT